MYTIVDFEDFCSVLHDLVPLGMLNLIRSEIQSKSSTKYCTSIEFEQSVFFSNVTPDVTDPKFDPTRHQISDITF